MSFSGGKDSGFTLPLGVRSPGSQRPSPAAPVIVGQCIEVIEPARPSLGGSLGTVMGGAGAVHALPRVSTALHPHLRLVVADALPSVQQEPPLRVLLDPPPIASPPSRSTPPSPSAPSSRRAASSGPALHAPSRLGSSHAPTPWQAQLAPPAQPAPPSAAPCPPQPAPAARAAATPQPARAEPAAPQPTPGAPQRELFRKAALAARHADGPVVEDPSEPKLGAWTLLALLLSLVAALFCGAALLSVEVTVRAPGALRAPNGLRSVESVLSGAVTEVLVQAGDEVAADQVVARLEEAQLRATLTLRERELSTLRADTAQAALADAALLEQTRQAVQRQRAALGRRSNIHQDQLRQRSQQLENLRELRRHGVASGNEEVSGEESVQAAAESVALVGSQVAELNLSLADRQREWKQRELERSAQLSRAMAALDEARSLLALAEIRAPAAGRVESLLATPGAVVQPGEVLAQIVPRDAPRAIVAFLPSRETAFVSVGSEANVEVESLPVNEFGMARARVRRISADIAKPEEVSAAFGEALAGPLVRVELELLDDASQRKMAPHLRSGERVLVRLHRRQQRVLSLIFEFTRKWLGG